MTSEWIAIANLAEIPEDGSFSVEHLDKKVVVFIHLDQVYALEDWCPHIGTMLSEGPRNDLTIECPLHGTVYSITTGAALSEPNWGPARSFPARVIGDTVEIDWSKRAYALPHPS